MHSVQPFPPRISTWDLGGCPTLTSARVPTANDLSFVEESGFCRRYVRGTMKHLPRSISLADAAINYLLSPAVQSEVVEEVRARARRPPLPPDPLVDQPDSLYTPPAYHHTPPGDEGE